MLLRCREQLPELTQTGTAPHARQGFGTASSNLLSEAEGRRWELKGFHRPRLCQVKVVSEAFKRAITRCFASTSASSAVKTNRQPQSGNRLLCLSQGAAFPHVCSGKLDLVYNSGTDKAKPDTLKRCKLTDFSSRQKPFREV